MRALLLVMLVACRPPALFDDGDQECPSDQELRAFAASPRGDRLAVIDYVEGGGAAGYVGYSVRVAARGHEWRAIAFVRAADVAIAWRDDDHLIVTGSFDDWDLRENTHSLAAAERDGIHAQLLRP